jgi:hypothetical protein
MYRYLCHITVCTDSLAHHAMCDIQCHITVHTDTCLISWFIHIFLSHHSMYRHFYVTSWYVLIFMCHITVRTDISVSSQYVQDISVLHHGAYGYFCVTSNFLRSLPLRWDIVFIPAIEGCGGVPPIRPLETLHNALSLRQLDQFLDVMTSAPLFRTPASSPPKNPSTPVPSATSVPPPPLHLQSPSGSEYSCASVYEPSAHFKLLPLTGANRSP